MLSRVGCVFAGLALVVFSASLYAESGAFPSSVWAALPNNSQIKHLPIRVYVRDDQNDEDLLPSRLQPKTVIPLAVPSLKNNDSQDIELKKAMAKRMELEFGNDRYKIRVRKRGVLIEVPFR